jgi:hypothetical protein
MKKVLYITSVLTVMAISGLQAQKPVVREVSSEANVAKGSLVRIVGANRKLNIKSWDQAKVKVTVQIAYDSSLSRDSNEEWFESLGISIKPFSNRVDILANRSGYTAITTTPLAAVTVTGYPKKKTAQPTAEQRAKVTYAEDLLATTNQAQRAQGVYLPATGLPSSHVSVLAMEIMVPTASKLDIDNQYGDVVIGMNLDEAKLDISNGALDMQDVKNLELTGKYCNANFGNIEKAEVEFQNGTFRAQNINDLDLDSKYSTIEYEKGKDLYLRSQADNITIDEITKLEGRKTYGSVRVDMLNGGFDLEGNNVDIKIRNINPQVELIKINNKYGDVRLPVKNLKNYFVDFTGYYSTVFTPFPKTIVKEDEKKQADDIVDKVKEEKDLADMAMAGQYFRSSATLAGEMAPKRFTGSVGDVNGKHTRFQLTCHSCTVDFK